MTIHSHPPVWITGAGGLIGQSLLQSAPLAAPCWTPLPLYRNELELTDPGAVEKRFRRDRPRAVLHCAAITRVGDCEAHPEHARRVNVEVTRQLAHLAEGIPFLFFSTDLVFDGRSPPYREDSPVSPLIAYGRTKAEAETFVLTNPRHAVVRTSLNYGHSREGNRAFNETMFLALQEGRTLTLFEDEYRCPLPAEITARASWELLNRQTNGLFHVAGAERLSRWEIGLRLANHWGRFHNLLNKGSVSQFEGPPRPQDLNLVCDKIQQLLSFPLPQFTEWLSLPNG